jgi:hypothetical protein
MWMSPASCKAWFLRPERCGFLSAPSFLETPLSLRATRIANLNVQFIRPFRFAFGARGVLQFTRCKEKLSVLARNRQLDDAALSKESAGTYFFEDGFQSPFYKNCNLPAGPRGLHFIATPFTSLCTTSCNAFPSGESMNTPLLPPSHDPRLV